MLNCGILLQISVIRMANDEKIRCDVFSLRNPKWEQDGQDVQDVQDKAAFVRGTVP